ncbi:MAG: ribonuclease HIII [Candidatus Lokiarchaeota archaeon]
MKSIKLSDSEVSALKSSMEEMNIKSDNLKSDNEDLRIKHDNYNFILYKSNALVFKDNEIMNNFLKSILKSASPFNFVIGSDEVGKGEWYGPLVVVAVGMKPDNLIKYRLSGIKDSKSLSKRKIKKLSEELLNDESIRFEKIVLLPKSYNDLYLEFTKENKNLNDLMAWAHSRAIENLLKRIKSSELKIKITIDKFDLQKMDQRLEKIKAPNINIIQKSKGESEIPVAIAAILAKQFFEDELDVLNEEFNINLKRANPNNLSKEILYNVSKLHFSNVPF